MVRVLFSRGTAAKFSSLSTIDPNTLYFLTDTHEIYLGENRFAIGEDISISITGSGDCVVGASFNQANRALTLTLGEAGSLQSVTTAITTALEAVLDDYVQSVSAVNNSAISVDNTDTQNPVVGLNIATGAEAGNVVLTQTSNGLAASVTIPTAPITGVKAGEKVIGLDGTELTSTLTVATATHDDKTWVQLKGISGQLVSEFDASAFIIDGMLDSVALEDGTGAYAGKKVLHFVFNTDAGKQDIYVDVTDLVNIYSAAQGGGLALNANNEFSIDNTVTAGTAMQAATLAFGQANNISVAEYDTHGLVTGSQTITLTLPSVPAGVVGSTINNKVVTYTNLDSSALSGQTVDIVDTAPTTIPATVEIPSSTALYDAMLFWDSIN